MKAKAAIFREIGEGLTFEEVDVDDPAPNEVRVRTAACGVCHSDLHFMKGSILGPKPTIPGHEPAGIVEAVGSEVRSVQVGDHVVACTSMFCGSCKQCMLGRPHLCTNRGALRRPRGSKPRITLGDGTPLAQFADLSGFSELMLLHERAVVKIADDLPLDRAALVGCGVTTGVGAALNTAKVQPGSSVAVFGCGGVGASVIQGARLAGARQIIAIDVVPEKLDTARHFGATDVLLSGDDDPVKAIKRLSGGGVDFAFDAVGLPALSAQCLYALAPRGVACIVGAIPTGMKLELEPGHFYVEKTLVGSIMGSNRFHIDIPNYLELYRQDKLDLDSMISARVALDDVDEALAAMEGGKVTRSVITFDV